MGRLMMVLNMCCRFGMFSSLSKLGNFGMEGFALKEKKRKKQKKLQPGNRNVIETPEKHSGVLPHG